MLLNYRYKMDLDFSQPVSDQHFSIMCLPRDTERQICIEKTVRIYANAGDIAGPGNQPDRRYNGSAAEGAEVTYDYGRDGLGNPYVHGMIRAPHSSFCLISEGTVQTGASLYEEYEDPESVGLWRYRVDSAHTVPGPLLKALHGQMRADAPEDEYGIMLHAGNCVQAALSYVSGVTAVDTTAEEALSCGKGVCQDYAHVMIALLRLSGIPARYVVGLIPGEGETHAWVEANCRGYWYGIDPTNNLLVNDNYIKFSHGRDYTDCMISRGIFTNPYALQTTRAGVSVREAEQ